ncbi:helix-turn-helix domain-containing protein, partial [Streptomyces sp. NPDC048479]|uniref:helix-turn-helix domain-containing protein n=1 Tax=Streptomyces sp. NPDC048479 TaxID=3154725 RepID=UPI00341CED9F
MSETTIEQEPVVGSIGAATSDEQLIAMLVDRARPIAEVAREIQVNEGTLGTWVSRYRQEHAGE